MINCYIFLFPFFLPYSSLFCGIIFLKLLVRCYL
nr:MAG TPA: hypothetical protein [Caudoviricetes sp.]